MSVTSDHAKSQLAVTSSGGHWVQLLRLRPAVEGCRVCRLGEVLNEIRHAHARVRSSV